MRYLTLFTLEILHGYYADGRCPDFLIEPAPDTRRLLKGHRCVQKPFRNGLRVLTPIEPGSGAFIPFRESTVFAFRLRLLNPDFELFTDMTDTDLTRIPLYANNAPGASGDLVPVSRERVSAEKFIVQTPSAQETFRLHGRPSPNSGVAGSPIVEGLGKKAERCGYDPDTNTIVVDSSKVKPGSSFTVRYSLSLAEPERGVFAEAELRFSPGAPKLEENAESFRITFGAKKARWIYYVLTDGTNLQSVLPTLEDKERIISFGEAELLDFSKGAVPDDGIARGLAERYPGGRCFRFVSSGLVPCSQRPRKSIQLRLNGNGVMGPLPNPPLPNYRIDLRDSEREHTLYQVIRNFIQ